MTDLASKVIRSTPEEDQELFRQYSIALRMWCRRFNTAEIGKHLGVHEAIVHRWIRHWRELSREGMVQ